MSCSHPPTDLALTSPTSQSDADSAVDTGPVVRRPGASSSRPKSRLRVSFNPSEASEDTTPQPQSSDDETQISRPLKRKSLAHQAASTSLLRQSINPSTSSTLPLRDRSNSPTSDRPSYSKDYLSELKSSHPSTPANLSSTEDEDLKTLDLASKFGAPSHTPTSGSIPTATEIREKKDRRARLAAEHAANPSGTEEKEKDFISLDDYDSDGEFKPRRMQVGSYIQPKEDEEEDTRLVRDDEDIAEGFEDFVEDAGRVTLSRKGRRAQERREFVERQAMVAEAEDISNESDSSAEANEAYERAQMGAGIFGVRTELRNGNRDGRGFGGSGQKRYVEPKLTPIPTLGDVIRKVKEEMQALQIRMAQTERERKELDEGLEDVEKREKWIQEQLTEAGEGFEEIRREVLGKEVEGGGLLNSGRVEERGLDSLGGAPAP